VYKILQTKKTYNCTQKDT